MSRRSVAQLTAAVLLFAGVVLVALLPVPYLLLSPGPVINTLGTVGGSPLITVSGAPTFPTTGRLDLTTVSELGGPVSDLGLLQAVRGWFSPTDAVVPVSLYYPDDVKPGQVQEENAALMTQSQDAAAVAALRELGIPVTETVVVARVSPGSPSEGKLQVGDVVVSVDGTPTATPEAVRAQIDKRSPGDVVVMGIQRAETVQKVSITTRPSPTDPQRAQVGFIPGTGYDSDVKVTIKLDDVGGPSAGLMFSLGIVDTLTEVQETAGRHIAGTGTMDSDGRVGPIGGIEQKLAGAKQAGATLFLVPAQNCPAARTSAPAGLTLAKVETLDGALKALNAYTEGRPVPGC